jgi:D-sedoheptulose 7-phosphate isomerase
MEYDQLIEDIFRSSTIHIETALTACLAPLAAAIRKASTVIEQGGTLFFAGNGGSAADACHAASELVGAFEHYAAPIPAVSLSADLALITSIANDFSFDRVFVQQASALVKPADQLWLISTSGNSMNLFHAAAWARDRKISTVGLLGRRGGRLATQVDYPIIVPGDNTQRIQEVHIIVLHILASALKRNFPDGVNVNHRPLESNEFIEMPELDDDTGEEIDTK